ncbi:MAG: DEAD/DEAH box helicase, partial [Candidatus Aenigmatarchaeota archaeon]
MNREEREQILKDISGELKEYMEYLKEMKEEGIPGVVSSLETEVSPGQYEDREFPAFYQMEGVKEILDNKRMLIADEMGVGKTAQAVAAKPAIEDKENQRVRSLIISPDYVKDHWEREINRYLEDEQKIVRIDSYENEDIWESEDADFTLVNYHAFGNPDTRDRLTDFFLQNDFNYLVLDETHNVKNPKALRSSRIKTISDNSEYLCMLSGTPIPDTLKDTFNLIAMLEPDNYEDAEDVRKRHWDDPRIIRNVLNRKRVRRNLDDVTDVPPIQTNLDGNGGTIELAEEQRKLYDAVLKNDSLEGPKKLRELRYALLDPKLVDPDAVPDSNIRSKLGEMTSTKYERLDEIVEEVSDRDEKVVVYSPHRVADVTEKLEDRYGEYGSLRIDGRVQPMERRMDRVKEFKENDDNHVLIATPATAGEGISLVEASNVVFLDEPYSPGEREQLLSRVRRRGQDKPVEVTSLSVKDSIDEGVLELLDKKQKAIDFMESGKELSSEDRELLSRGGGRPVRERMYTPQQKIRIYSSRMFGVGHDKI